jgi:hypothetical protein
MAVTWSLANVTQILPQRNQSLLTHYFWMPNIGTCRTSSSLASP